MNSKSVYEAEKIALDFIQTVEAMRAAEQGKKCFPTGETMYPSATSREKVRLESKKLTRALYEMRRSK